jgi:hypothetical protein
MEPLITQKTTSKMRYREKCQAGIQTTDISLDVSIGLSDEKLFDRSAFTLSFSTA